MKMRTCFLIGVTAATLGLAACTATPVVTKTEAMMTPSEIREAGLICRKDRPPDTNIPRTICASEAAWAGFDERRRRETEDLLAEGRKNANVGRFNRD